MNCPEFYTLILMKNIQDINQESRLLDVLRSSGLISQEPNFVMGYVSGVVGFIFLSVSIASFILSYAGKEEYEGLFIVLCVFFLYFGFFFISTHKKISSINKAYKQLQDRRPPVLYLRSFGADDPHFSVKRFIQFILPKYLLDLSGGDDKSDLLDSVFGWTEEVKIAMSIKKIGPFIAYGDPGEGLPDLGAYRFYLPSKSKLPWKDSIINIMNQSGLVLIKINLHSDGLVWELKTALKTLDPRKLILYSKMGETEYTELQELFFQHKGIQLPDRKTNHIICFDENWSPVASEVRTPYLMSFIYRASISKFYYAMKPLYERCGVSWQRPPVAWSRFLLLALFICFFIYIFYFRPPL